MADNIPESFKAIHSQISACTSSVLSFFIESFKEHPELTKVDHLDNIYSFYEIYFFLLFHVDILSNIKLKDKKIREDLFQYLIDELFRDLDIDDPVVKNVIVKAMNERLEEYSDNIKKDNHKEWEVGNIEKFVKYLTHTFMKNEFSSRNVMSFYPLQKGVILHIFMRGAELMIKYFVTTMELFFEKGDHLVLLNEEEIKQIIDKAYNKNS